LTPLAIGSQEEVSMRQKLREDWYRREIDPSTNLDAAGVYQWSIEGVGVYVGKAKKLRTRLSAYPRNVLAMLEGRSWHGDATKDYRQIHHKLRAAYETGKVVMVTVLETCEPEVRANRERHWIAVRRAEAEQGGPPVLNSN
jgi:hypothetical protein